MMIDGNYSSADESAEDGSTDENGPEVQLRKSFNRHLPATHSYLSSDDDGQFILPPLNLNNDLTGEMTVPGIHQNRYYCLLFII